MSEKTIQTQIMIGASSSGARVFRNNTGNGVLGQIVSQAGGTFVVKNGRRVQFGLCVGSSDLIGWRTITVTPEMIGRRVALFLALEVKTASGAATPEQRNFIEQVRSAGGLSAIVRSSGEAIAACNPLEVGI